MEKQTYAIIGYPLKHTFSPAMHNAAFQELNIPAEYKAMEIPPDGFQTFLYDFREMGLSGFNVTVPYKKKIMEGLDDLSQYGIQMIGSINTAKIMNDIWLGFNTDWFGFQEGAKEDLGFTPVNKNVLILGAGGAANACLFALCKGEAREVVIANRTEEFADDLAEKFTAFFPKTKLRSLPLDKITSGEEILSRFDLVVNATSCGLKEEDPLLIPKEIIPEQEICFYDLIYNPAETKLMKATREKGWKVANGTNMLLHQGASAFEIWTEKIAPLEVMREALKKELAD